MKIAIITGGETGEREISIKSALYAKQVIDFAETEIFIFPEDKSKFIAAKDKTTIVFPIIHGLGGEDGELQRWLAELNIPFIFSDPQTHTIAIDKKRAKEIAATVGLTTPENSSAYPLFAKPRFGGSSILNKICYTEEEFKNLQANNPETEFITEALVKGREFTVGVIESRGKTMPLPVIEIISKGAFFDFENKYDPIKQAEEICPANIGSELSAELQRQALLIHNTINARHISRSDFIVTPQDTIYFLEINTIPGMTEVSLLPKMLKTAGLDLEEVMREWCEEINSNRGEGEIRTRERR